VPVESPGVFVIYGKRDVADECLRVTRAPERGTPMQVRQTSLLFVAVLGMLMPGVRTRAVTITPPPVSLAKCSIPAAAPQAGDSQAAPGQAGASSGRATVLPVGQVQHFAKANLTVSAGTTTDGAIQIEARGTNLTFRKKVSANGRYTVEIEGPRDKVALSVTESSIAVTRGKKTLTVSPDSSQSQLDDVRKLLVDSRAVDMLRSAGAEFEVSEEDSSAATPVFASGRSGRFVDRRRRRGSARGQASVPACPFRAAAGGTAEHLLLPVGAVDHLGVRGDGRLFLLRVLLPDVVHAALDDAGGVCLVRPAGVFRPWLALVDRTH
jgi:hypothetical protein